MITISNYGDRIEEIGIANLSPGLREGHNFLMDATNNNTDWSIYHEVSEIRDTIDVYLEKLNELYETRKPVKTPDPVKRESSVRKEKQKKAPASQKKEQSKKEASVKKARKKEKEQERDDVNFVEHLREEIKFIKRFVGLHNKIKTANAIANFIKALQKAIVQRLIRKESPLAKDIKVIQEVLVTQYNKMGETVTMRFDDKDLAKLVNLAGGEQVYPSINLIKRFIGLEGKPLDGKKLENLLKAIAKAKDNKLVKEGDPYLDRVLGIERELKKARAGQVIRFPKEELNGLNGIVKACGCKDDLGKIYKTASKKLQPCKKRTYSDSKGRGTCSYNKGMKKHKGLSGIMTAEEVANQTYDELTFAYPWNQIVKSPAKRFIMMLHGEPFSGKTTFLLKFVNYLANNHYDNVMYITGEEYGASTITKKVNEVIPVRPDNLRFAGKLESVNLDDYDLVILDSVNYMDITAKDFKKIKEDHPDTAFILVLQVTKKGDFRGGKDWEHESDIAGSVENGTIKIYKNRYASSNTDRGSFNFFEAA